MGVGLEPPGGNLRETRAMVRKVLVVLCCALVVAPAAIGQARSSEQVPEGLSAADWSSIQAAYRAGRQQAQPPRAGQRTRPDENGTSYSLTSGSIAQQAYLKASNTDLGDSFGLSVAVSGDTVVVGADREDSNATGVNGNQADNSAQDAGAAYVFVRSGTSWSQQAYLKASNTDAGDNFGSSVAVSGDTLVVGAWGEASNTTGVNGSQADNSKNDAGAAYVFVRSGTSWSQQAYLKASNTDSNDHFGWFVAVSGDTLVVGAQDEGSNATGVNGNQSDNSTSGAGAAYVFVRNGTSWSQQAYLKASNTDSNDLFGRSVAVSGDTVVVGALNEDSNATGVNGNQADNSAPCAGAAYVFVRNGTGWSQQAYLKASNTDALAFDAFGWSVAVSGNTVVVGSPGEDSAATGVNGNQADNSAPGAGAAYVFVRNGTSWSQQAYLKASNTDSIDQFGYRVAVSGDTLVVGVEREDSNATGVNGDQSDNSAQDAGAAYVFVRNGSSWSQQAYLKASNTDSNDRFGYGVAVSGDTVVLGAWLEGSNATGINGDEGDNSAPAAGAAYVFELFPNPWTDLGNGLAGTGGLTPVLTGTGSLTGGSSNQIDLNEALPNSTTNLVVGLTRLDAPFKGGVLVPFPDFLLLGLPVDANGVHKLPFTWPLGLPVGSKIIFQHWVWDFAGLVDFSASNGLLGESQ
jgi:hypothetical protein